MGKIKRVRTVVLTVKLTMYVPPHPTTSHISSASSTRSSVLSLPVSSLKSVWFIFFLYTVSIMLHSLCGSSTAGQTAIKSSKDIREEKGDIFVSLAEALVAGQHGRKEGNALLQRWCGGADKWPDSSRCHSLWRRWVSSRPPLTRTVCRCALCSGIYFYVNGQLKCSYSQKCAEYKKIK